MICFAKTISKVYTPSIGVGQSLAFYFIYEIKIAESVILYFNLHFTKLNKICLLSHCLFCFKSLMHMYKKCDILTKIIKTLSGYDSFSLSFIIVLKQRPNQTRFFITAKYAQDDLLSISTSRIFLARCKLSDYESP